MRCPKCQTENPDDSKFCKECASSLLGSREAQPLHIKTLESPALVLNPGDVLSERYEILQLRWNQIDFENRVITVERTKSGRSRQIPINLTLFDEFSRLRVA